MTEALELLLEGEGGGECCWSIGVEAPQSTRRPT
jgi:hypothetical protein